jgi:enoyl-CoA hydratase
MAVEAANRDDDVHVIILTGAGRAFCAGYDLKEYAESETSPYTQEMPWDPMIDFDLMHRNTQDFMSLWRSHKPTIAKIRGFAVAGGSDIALCCDLIVMTDDAKIGYPPTRVWGCPTTAMWVYRVGAERAKRMLLTGDLITGLEAKDIGLVIDCVPELGLDDRVAELANRIKGVPRNQLMMQKLMVNQAFDNMGWPRPRCWRRCSTVSPATPPKGCGSRNAPRKSGSSRRLLNATQATRSQTVSAAALINQAQPAHNTSQRRI